MQVMGREWAEDWVEEVRQGPEEVGPEKQGVEGVGERR